MSRLRGASQREGRSSAKSRLDALTGRGAAHSQDETSAMGRPLQLGARGLPARRLVLAAVLGATLLGARAAQAHDWLGPTPTLPATRIITLAPSLTETVLALGAQGSLIGVSRFCEFPEVAALPRAGGFNDPSVETIVALKPQVVIVQKGPGNQKPVETLARLGIPVLALSLTSLADVSAAMTELGRVTGKQERARQLVEELAAARAKERSRAAAAPRRVLFVYGFSPLVVAGPGSFADELLTDCGARNVAARAATAYPAYSLESAVKLVPDVIVDAADVKEGRADLEKLPPLARVKWVDLPSRDLLHPGPALAKALPALCALVR